MASAPPRRLALEEAFELLLRAREGDFDPNIPCRPTASPINRSIECFYVVPNAARAKSSGEPEMRVKYNNVIRSRIWWSPKHGELLGVVSRAMSMKTRSESHESHRSFSHGFQGQWISLLERDSTAPISDKAQIRSFVKESVPGLVQFWPAPARRDKRPVKREGLAAIDAGAMQQQQQQQQQLESDEDGVSPCSLATMVSSPRPTASPMLHEDGVPLDFVLGGGEGSVDGSVDGLIDGFSMMGSTGALGKKKRRNLEEPVHESGTVPKGPRRELLASDARSMGSSVGSLSPKPKAVTNSDLQLALDCILDDTGDAEEHDLAAEPPCPAREEASVVAFELFKNACDIMEATEFSTWFDRHVQRLFTPEVATEVKKALDNNDPRLSPDFLFPERFEFLPEVPTASAVFRGDYSSGWELVQGSKELTDLVGWDTQAKEAVGNIQLYESLLESQILDLFSHLVYKRKVSDGSIHPYNYVFQTIANLTTRKSDPRIIVRVHCRWRRRSQAGSEEAMAIMEADDEMDVLLQDVSMLFPTILELPPLPY